MMKFAIVFVLFFVGCNEKEVRSKPMGEKLSESNQKVEKEPVTSIPESEVVEVRREVLEAFSKMSVGITDSGKPIDQSFLKNCVREKTASYYHFSCNDLTFDFFAAVMGEIIYIIQDGTSVENRNVFKVNNEKVEKINDPLPSIFTAKKVAELINLKFGVDDYTEGKIMAIAHSHYRTILPKGKDQKMVITSGELGRSEHSYQPIATIEWDGSKPIISHIK